jgi:transcriptional regulator with XRE-family HTH domain
MDDQQVGQWVRSERRRQQLRQADLAECAGVSRTTVSRVECGRLSELTISSARAVAGAVGIQLPFAPRSPRGTSIERQIDWRHAALVESTVRRLSALGWETTVEYSFNDYGDRGSIDVLGWHARARALLIVEVKSELRNVQETLHTLDIKCRVVPRLLRGERGWNAASVGVVVVLADLAVERRRVESHSSTFDSAFPARTVEVRRWMKSPGGPLRGIWFLAISRTAGAKHGPLGRERVRSHSYGAAKPSRRVAARG